MANNRLPNPNRYITDNDADGNSFFSTGLPASVEVGGDLGGALQRLGYQTEQSPVSLSSNNDLERYKTALWTKVHSSRQAAVPTCGITTFLPTQKVARCTAP